MTFLELRAAIISLLNKAGNLSAEEVYGVVASVEAEVRLSMFAAMKETRQAATHGGCGNTPYDERQP